MLTSVTVRDVPPIGSHRHRGTSTSPGRAHSRSRGPRSKFPLALPLSNLRGEESPEATVSETDCKRAARGYCGSGQVRGSPSSVDTPVVEAAIMPVEPARWFAEVSTVESMGVGFARTLPDVEVSAPEPMPARIKGLIRGRRRQPGVLLRRLCGTRQKHPATCCRTTSTEACSGRQSRANPARSPSISGGLARSWMAVCVGCKQLPLSTGRAMSVDCKYAKAVRPCWRDGLFVCLSCHVVD
jgi:hypothetical protein